MLFYNLVPRVRRGSWEQGCFSYLLLNYSPSCLCGTKGSNEIFPTLLIFSQFFNGAPAVIELPSLFYSCAPSCFWAPSVPFAIRCPAHCNSVVITLPQHMPDSSPSFPVTRVRFRGQKRGFGTFYGVQSHNVLSICLYYY